MNDEKWEEEFNLICDQKHTWIRKCKALEARLAEVEKENKELQNTITQCEHEVSKVYCHITDNKFSKMNTMAEHVIDEAEQQSEAALVRLGNELFKLKERLAVAEKVVAAARKCNEIFSPSDGERFMNLHEAIDAFDATQAPEVKEAKNMHERRMNLIPEIMKDMEEQWRKNTLLLQKVGAIETPQEKAQE